MPRSFVVEAERFQSFDPDRPSGDDDRWDRRSRQLFWALIAAGLIFRLIRYFANRSLWLDESFLAESLVTYSFKQLATETLLHWQAAPVGFLVLEKLAITLVGTSELGLRLVPLLAGLASVPTFASIARRCLPPAGALVALALFVTVEPLVYYSSEVKQYGVDVFICVAILLFALRSLAHPDSLAAIAALGIFGVVSMFVSHTSVFLIAAAGIVLFINAARQRRSRAVAALVIAGVTWAVFFAIDYYVLLRPLTKHEGLIAYWSSGYMPHDAKAVIWLGKAVHGIYADYSTMWMPLPDVSLLVGVIGVAWLWHTDRRRLGLIGLPIVLALAAAALHRFPFSGRLILFVVPLAILFLGAGLQAIVDATRLSGKRCVAGVVLFTLLGPAVGRVLFFAVRPPGREETKSLIAEIGAGKQPGDIVYAFNSSQVPFRYYRDRFGTGEDRYRVADLKWIAGNRIEPSVPAWEAELAPLRGNQRVWILISHIGALQGPDERQFIRDVLEKSGRKLSEHASRGGLLMLYDLSQPPAGKLQPAD